MLRVVINLSLLQSKISDLEDAVNSSLFLQVFITDRLPELSVYECDVVSSR